MNRPAASSAAILVIMVLWLSLAGCGGGVPEIKVSYLSGDTDDSFQLVNSSDQEWSDVLVTVRQLRPDGVDAECASRQIESWPPGDAQVLPKCNGGYKTLITLEIADQQAFFVLAQGKLYQKFGRREILVQ